MAGKSAMTVAEYLRVHGIPEEIIRNFEVNSVDAITFSLITDEDLRELNVKGIKQRKYLLLVSFQWRRYIEDQCFKCYGKNFFRMARDNQDISFSPRQCCQPVDREFLAFLDCTNQSLPIQPYFQSVSITHPSDVADNSVELSIKRWKVLVSAVYCFVVAGLTSIAMVFAHERLPDMSKYPPLPDLLLDNLPHITWAFKAAESVGVILLLMWLTVIFFHQYRFILIRRFFSICGTVFLLRCFTMVITSLSVPGRHLADHCAPHRYMNDTLRFKRVLEIWMNMGLSIRGIQTCGDYMFSGHTAMLTLLNFFVTEYSPRNYQWVHTFSWVLNLFGVFFVLASHEHYSIDVFAAIYVSSRLFLYYHCLANSLVLHQPDKKRTMIWFPLFSFFEYDVRGIVPNAYEWPFSDWSVYKCYLKKFSIFERWYVSNQHTSCAKSIPVSSFNRCKGSSDIHSKSRKHDKFS